MCTTTSIFMNILLKLENHKIIQMLIIYILKYFCLDACYVINIIILYTSMNNIHCEIIITEGSQLL